MLRRCSRRLLQAGALLVALATLLLLLPETSNAGAGDATGRPRILLSEEGYFLFADVTSIKDSDGLPFTPEGTGDVIKDWKYTYQWIRIDSGTGTETNIGTDSERYALVDDDIGHKIKVTVSFTDDNSNAESLDSLPYGPIVEQPSRALTPPTTLISNTGQTGTTATSVSSGYENGFRLGEHGQGYEITSVTIDFASAPSNLTVSLWIGGIEGARLAGQDHKLFDFANPATLRAGLNTFTAPRGAFLFQHVNYWIQLSGFSGTLMVNQTSSGGEDPGGEPGAFIFNESSKGGGALRMSIEGARRDSGILASNFTKDYDGLSQELISLGDEIEFEVTVGEADRYVIRGMTFPADDTTHVGGSMADPFSLRKGVGPNGEKQFTLINTRWTPGLNEWRAPHGSTVAGASSGTQLYTFVQDQESVHGNRLFSTLTRVFPPDGVGDMGDENPGVDPGNPLGASLSVGGDGGARIATPGDAIYMVVFGEPLYEVVSNFGESDARGYLSLGGSTKVVSQGFTTGADRNGYRFQGIGVNVQGSDSGGTPQVPSNASSVSVAVYTTDSDGRPDNKVYDLISPGAYKPGHTFFEAPEGAELAPYTEYAMVWTFRNGTWQRLQRTSGDGEDSGAHPGFSVANGYYSAGNFGGLSSANRSGDALEIAVYAEVFQVPTSPPVTGERTLVRNTPVGSFGNEQLHGNQKSTGAQAFVTGSNPTGYTLSSIAFRVGTGTSEKRLSFTATLHHAEPRGTGANDYQAAEEICELSGVAYHVVDTFSEFVVPASCSQLEPNTRYFFVLERDSSSRGVWWARDNDTSEDSDSADGWSIDNERLIYNSLFQRWEERESSALSIEVKGAPNAAPLPDESDSILYLPMVERPFGMWSDGRTLWIVDQADDAIYAFDLFTGERRPHDDFSLGSSNRDPQGLWSDGTTMYVSDSRDTGGETYKIYAYKMSDKSRDSGKDISLGDLYTPRGIWGNGSTLWVTQDVHSGRSEEHELLAYKLGGSSHGDRDSGKDIDTLHDVSNWALGGVWSDGTTIWVVDHGDDRAYAYRLSDGKRVIDREIVFESGNSAPRGIWSPDGQRFYIGDSGDDAIYVYGAELEQTYWTGKFRMGNSVLGSQGWSSTAGDFSGDELVTGTSLELTVPGKSLTVSGVLHTTTSSQLFISFGESIADGDFDGLQLEIENETDSTEVVFDFADGFVQTLQDYVQFTTTSAPFGNRDNVSVTISQTRTVHDGSGDVDIDGDPVTGGTLTADVNSVTDSNGTDNVSTYGYQWYADGEMIIGASDETLELTPFLAGKQITVKVYYFDDDGFQESFESSAVGPVAYDATRYEGFSTSAVGGTLQSVWANGDTLWVGGDFTDDEFHAFNLYGDRQADADIDQVNEQTRFLTGDYLYLWAAEQAPNSGTDRLTRALLRSDPTDADARREIADIEHCLDPINLSLSCVASPTAVASDGARLWFSDSSSAVQSFSIYDDPATPVNEYGVDTGTITFSFSPDALWTDGELLWALDSGGGRVEARELDGGARRSILEINVPRESNSVSGMWSNGVTLFVADPADERINTYRIRHNASEDELGIIRGSARPGSQLRVDASGIDDPQGVPNSGFTYQWLLNGIPISGATNSNYTVKGSDLGHQISVRINFTDNAGQAESLVARPRVIHERVALPTPNAHGLWGDTWTLWVSGGHINAPEVRAFDRFTGQRVTSRDIDLTQVGAVFDSTAIWSDGVTIWVAEANAETLFAFNLSDGSYDSSKDISLRSNAQPTGLWGNADTIWVADNEINPELDADTDSVDKLYAYKHSDGSRQASKDFNTLDAAGNDDPGGIWSDGTTMWVVDKEDDKVYAYKMSDQSRDPSRDFLLDGEAAHVRGMWAPTPNKIYVLDGFNQHAEIYKVEPAIWSATLSVGVDTSGNDPVYGWNKGGDYVGGALSEDEFSYDGEDYQLIELQYSDGELSLVFDSTKSFDGASQALLQRLRLWVDGYGIPLSDIDHNQDNFIWSNIPAYQSRSGAKVELKITVADVAPTGQIALTGTAALGEVLTADISGVADGNGIPDAQGFHYRWKADADVIRGATAPQLYPSNNEPRDVISVQALTIDDDGYEVGPIPSDAKTVVEDPTRSVPWSSTMTAESRGNGYESPLLGDLADQEFSVGSDTFDVVLIKANTVSVLLRMEPAPSAAQEGSWEFLIRGAAFDLDSATKGLVGTVRTYEWSRGSFDQFSDGDRVAVAMVFPVNAPATGTPAISGDMTVNTTLTADTSGISDANGMDSATLTYKWERVGCATTSDNVTLADTDDDYTVIQADLGSGCGIKLTVSFTDDDGFAESLSITRTTRVSIIGIAITSTAGHNLFYDIGDRIEVTLTYNEAMVVSGVPQLSIQLGNKPELANYVSSASTSTALVFRYRVVEDDEDTDGISFNANSLTLNGGSIVAAAPDAVAADLTHPGLTDDADHKVDGVRPTIMTAVVEGDTVTLTGSENLSRSYNNSAFHGGFSVAISGRSNPSVDQIHMGNETPTITLTLSEAARVNETVTLSYSRPSSPQPPIIDLAGNELNNFSNQSVTNNTPQTKPTPPRNLTAEPGNEQVTLRWDPPEYDGGSPITDIQIQISENSSFTGANWGNIANSGVGGANATSYTHVGLTNDTQYWFRIRAVNALWETVGQSDASNAATTTPVAGPGLKLSKSGLPIAETLDLPEGLTLTYDVKLAIAPTHSVTVTLTPETGLSVNPTTLTFTTSNWNTNQTVTVTAAHDNNATNDELRISHSLSSADPDYHGLEVPDFMGIVIDDDSEFTITANQQSVAEGETAHFTLSRTGDTSVAVDNVTLQVRDPGGYTTGLGPYNAILVDFAEDETSKTVSVATVDDTVDEPTGTITVRIPFDPDYLVGTPSSASTQVLDDDGPPGPPGNLTAHAGDGFVRLTWTEAPSASSEVTHYSYRYRERNRNWNPDWTQIPNSGKNTRSFTVSGLQNAVDYIFQIRATNVTGDGDHVGVTTAPFGPPGRPVLDLLSRGNAILASWTVPDDGGLAPDRYHIRWATDGRWENVLGDIQITDATQLSHLITGVEEYTTYYVRVRASNDGGQNWSHWDLGSIRKTPLPRMDNLTTSNPMPTRLTVNWWLIRDWDAAAGVPIWATEYEVQYIPITTHHESQLKWANDGQSEVFTSWGTGENNNAYADIDGLTCDKEYYVRMRARIDSPRLEHLDPSHWTPWSPLWPRSSRYRGHITNGVPDDFDFIEPWKTGPCAAEKSPTNLQVEFAADVALLSWVAPTSQGVNGYKIERGVFRGITIAQTIEPTQQIATVSGRANAGYVDTTLCANRAGQGIAVLYIVTSRGITGGPFGVHTSFLEHRCPNVGSLQSVQQTVEESTPEPQSAVAVLAEVPLEVAVEQSVESSLTVAAENLPLTHAGSEFTFELRFSENVQLSYAKLRDHALSASGGTVTKAQRLDRPGNQRWRITVVPDGAGPVTVSLPATSDCTAASAVCTADGTKLSNTLSLTIPGS